MAMLMERARRVPLGRTELLIWQALACPSLLAWCFAGAASGLGLAGALAYLAGGGYGTVLLFTGALGVLGSGAGFAAGRWVRGLATSGYERCARRVRWVTRYGWPAWLKAVSLAATAGVCASFWALTTTY